MWVKQLFQTMFLTFIICLIAPTASADEQDATSSELLMQADQESLLMQDNLLMKKEEKKEEKKARREGKEEKKTDQERSTIKTSNHKASPVDKEVGAVPITTEELAVDVIVNRKDENCAEEKGADVHPQPAVQPPLR